MQRSLNTPIIIENKSGAGTNIAADSVARAAPNGYTLMYADNGLLMFNEHLYKNMPVNPAKDLTYIGLISSFPLTIVANPKFAPNTPEEFITYIKNNPGKLNYGSPGVGSPHHLSMEILKQNQDLDIVHVPYRGSAPAMIDLISGEIPFMFVSIGSVLPVLDKLKVIAIAADERSPLLPNVPTLKEAGIVGVEASPVQGIVGPAGIPENITAKLNSALNEALASPKFVKRINEGYGSQ
ncbi:MAG: tripartite tricarboxylate transporter substrate binding protein, partial [Alcaligenaceae bacterium]|nr:tripartite tricarboxylate transporter substrate binding protein [Alcaligenaceae bacterium]